MDEKAYRYLRGFSEPTEEERRRIKELRAAFKDARQYQLDLASKETKDENDDV